MKVRTYVLIVLVGIITMSANIKESKSVVGVSLGDLAPGIKSLGSELGFQNESGRYTLVCFWAAYNAESRVQNIRLSNEVKKWSSDDIVMYSISCDENKTIFEETIKLDKLDMANQFNESDPKSVLYKQYRVNKGLKSYLINEDGIIIAVNPSLEKLTEYLRKG